jgi:hypothetical protein
MFTNNLKRSVAALPVAAGLLAAAAPASAQIGPSTIGLTTPPAGAQVATSQVSEFSTFGGSELAAKGFKLDGNELTVTSLKADSNEVAVEGFKPADEPRKGVQSRESIHGITMLDYDGTP